MKIFHSWHPGRQEPYRNNHNWRSRLKGSGWPFFSGEFEKALFSAVFFMQLNSIASLCLD
jgi:hypothetical protein